MIVKGGYSDTRIRTHVEEIDGYPFVQDHLDIFVAVS